LIVDPSNITGDEVLSGQLPVTEDGTILTFAREPVTGSYAIGKDCGGRATVRPKRRAAMHFSLLATDSGKEMLAI
jgi:hypothetical protein